MKGSLYRETTPYASTRHLEIMPVILSASFGSLRPASQTLRCAQGDRQDTSQARSREVLSPNVCASTRVLDSPFTVCYLLIEKNHNGFGGRNDGSGHLL